MVLKQGANGLKTTAFSIKQKLLAKAFVSDYLLETYLSFTLSTKIKKLGAFNFIYSGGSKGK